MYLELSCGYYCGYEEISVVCKDPRLLWLSNITVDCIHRRDQRPIGAWMSCVRQDRRHVRPVRANVLNELTHYALRQFDAEDGVSFADDIAYVACGCPTDRAEVQHLSARSDRDGPYFLQYHRGKGTVAKRAVAGVARQVEAVVNR